MTTYRLEIKYCQGYLLTPGRRDTIYATYPHCKVVCSEGANSVVLNYPGALYGGWNLKTLVSILKRDTRIR